MSIPKLGLFYFPNYWDMIQTERWAPKRYVIGLFSPDNCPLWFHFQFKSAGVSVLIDNTTVTNTIITCIYMYLST
jgi:hypothetical protein